MLGIIIIMTHFAMSIHALMVNLALRFMHLGEVFGGVFDALG